jgi:hypothetical protein
MDKDLYTVEKKLKKDTSWQKLRYDGSVEIRFIEVAIRRSLAYHVNRRRRRRRQS